MSHLKPEIHNYFELANQIDKLAKENAELKQDKASLEIKIRALELEIQHKNELYEQIYKGKKRGEGK